MKKQNRKNGLGFIIGSIPLLIIGILLIDLYFENFIGAIASYRLEMIEFPLYADEIQSDIHTTLVTIIILWVIIVSLITTAIIFLIVGIKKRKGTKK